ncbi:fructosamine kinase family protein [Gramella jeungdoensis]|uniref:Fructosamine kinase family protein n=1 Tax=Gramella jeungdoensis TaxID=708091 RepID=A0ABT0YZQ1_9FLAO|nr:fructosamine kinase family protein [Gramella jeungdoensis]MCM8568939.1 fructosamine kinase family protein [Gramella jeungdoensis]
MKKMKSINMPSLISLMNGNRLEDILKQIAEENGINYKNSSPLSGGDINEVYLLEGQSEKFVVKLNNASRFPGMFDAEKFGLEKLAEPKVIDIPIPFSTGIANEMAYLILEHKDSAQRNAKFWESFGEQMAELHKTTAQNFGLEKDNYIGSLPQYNESKDSAAEFYINMRLQPQIKMAEEKGFHLNVSDSFFKNCELLIPDERPSLVHGDLWNGNYLVNSEGLPCLIDPAIAFAPREMDLGMMKLFGGFNDRIFQVYNEVFPLESDWEKRIPLWQLYYLLVHLNIFGAGYRSQVTSIIKSFS